MFLIVEKIEGLIFDLETKENILTAENDFIAGWMLRIHWLPLWLSLLIVFFFVPTFDVF